MEGRSCYNCLNYFKCEKKPKLKLFPSLQELTCYKCTIDKKV